MQGRAAWGGLAPLPGVPISSRRDASSWPLPHQACRRRLRCCGHSRPGHRDVWVPFPDCEERSSIIPQSNSQRHHIARVLFTATG